jgi:hypothetical protein
MAKSPTPVSRPRPVPIQPPAREERTGPALPALQVRYYRRMHRQRVYTVTVSWEESEQSPPRGTPPVLLRLLIAGAQVVPSEQPLDPTKENARASFYVTPLAQGWLRGERLEVLADGRKVQEIPLSTHVTSQRMTWVLFALTILAPWFLLYYCKYAPFTPTAEERVELIKIATKENLRGEARALLQTPGGILDKRIADNLPELPDKLNDDVPVVRDYLVKARGFVGDVYQGLCNMSRSHPLAFYAAAGLGFLTVISWWVHREKRRWRSGAPIPLPEGGPVPLASPPAN